MSGEVTQCSGCASPSLIPVLDMGMQPLAEGVQSGTYPLKLVRCGNCSLVQLSYVVDPGLVFQADHPYSTGNSEALRDHYSRLAAQLADEYLSPGDVVIDIGANDGTFLENLAIPYYCVAVEPTDQILKCDPVITRYQEPFTAELAIRIRREQGAAKVITACNVLAHVPDPADFLDGVQVLLADDGTFITENHDVASVTEGLQVDAVYHEHLRYYSVASLSAMLDRNGFRVTHVQPVSTHGGSFRTCAVKQDGYLFSNLARYAVTMLHDILAKLAAAHDIWGIGASTRATPLIHFAEIAPFLSHVAEVPGSAKIGTFMPGTEIPVVSEDQLLKKDQPEYALLFAWHMKDVIIPKLRDRGYTGKFIVPLPHPEVLGD